MQGFHLECKEKHPMPLPKGYHISKLTACHSHHNVHYKGRQITHGAILQAGHCLVHRNQIVSKGLTITYKKFPLPWHTLEQRMANGTEATTPSTNASFNAFYPWMIQSQKSRGRVAAWKRWGLIFSCLRSRAIHSKVLESIDTSSSICVLQCLLCTMQPRPLIEWDRGTNFIGRRSSSNISCSTTTNFV